MPKLDSGALNDLFVKAEAADKELMSEQRSNILLTSGKHYGATSSRLWERCSFRAMHSSAASACMGVCVHVCVCTCVCVCGVHVFV